MELKFDRTRNFKERLDFVRFYVQWVKSVPNETWSAHQAELIDSFFENSENFSMSAEDYLRMKGELRE